MSGAIHPMLIGLTGPAGVGKDTAGHYLGLQHDYLIFAFADPLRDMLEALLCGWTSNHQYLQDRQLKEQPIPGLGISYRHLAQTLGTEWARSLDPDFWVKTAALITGLPSSPVSTRMVITDVRFPNEAAWIRSMGGSLVRLQRDACPVREHKSEQLFDQIETQHTLDNSGSPADLYQQLDKLVEQLESAA